MHGHIHVYIVGAHLTRDLIIHCNYQAGTGFVPTTVTYALNEKQMTYFSQQSSQNWAVQ